MVATLAVAQEPEPMAMYLARDVTSVRFAGEAFPGPAFEAGEAVMVLFRDTGSVRVFTGERYGWVEPDALTTEALTTDASPPPLAPPQGMNPLLGELPPLLQNPPSPSPGAGAPQPQ